MFDEFGPRGAEDEREGFWTDLSEVPDEQYRDEDEPKQTQEVIVPPAHDRADARHRCCQPVHTEG